MNPVNCLFLSGSNYYVRILSTIDRELLKPSASVALHKHSNALVDVLPPEADSSITMLGAGNHSSCEPGPIAQSVTCLATEACLTADPGVASLIPARSHTFVGTDHEIISTVILLPSAESFKKGCCQLHAKVCARSIG